MVIVYRWAENQIDRLPALATDLIQRRVKRNPRGGAASSTRRKGGDYDHSDCLRRCPRSSHAGSGRKFLPIGWLPDGGQFSKCPVGRKALGDLACVGAWGCPRPCACQSADIANTESTLRQIEPAGRAMGLQVRFSTLAQAARSMRPSRVLRTNGPTHSSSAKPVPGQPTRSVNPTSGAPQSAGVLSGS